MWHVELGSHAALGANAHERVRDVEVGVADRGDSPVDEHGSPVVEADVAAPDVVVHEPVALHRASLFSGAQRGSDLGQPLARPSGRRCEQRGVVRDPPPGVALACAAEVREPLRRVDVRDRGERVEERRCVLRNESLRASHTTTSRRASGHPRHAATARGGS